MAAEDRAQDALGAPDGVLDQDVPSGVDRRTFLGIRTATFECDLRLGCS